MQCEYVVMDVSALKLSEMMPHLRPVRFRQDQQLLQSDALVLATPFIYSPLCLSPAENSRTCAEHGCTPCSAVLYIYSAQYCHK